MAKSQHALIYRKVPALLRQMREKAGLTQRGIAERVNKPQPWVHKSEDGSRRVDVAEFLEWCVGCGIDPVEGFKQLMELRN
jgi:transcriptional regulator with XRE-family HTH domain